ncbi:MAG: hypothetical protein ABIZ05_02390 [Pseudonocardiaceae bacterium]
MKELYKAVTAFNDDLKASGAWVFASGLHTPDESSVVQSRGGEVLVTDDAALELAKRATLACRAPVEVRPFQDEPAA